MALLVRQFRAPVYMSAGRDDLLEAIAGIVDEDDAAAAARREALEEAGLTLTKLDHVGCLWSMPGIATERMDLFLAVYREADRIGAGGGLAEDLRADSDAAPALPRPLRLRVRADRVPR